jgi:hypothetical protein
MKSTPKELWRRDLFVPLALGTFSWLAIVLYWRRVGFSIYRSDLRDYIAWSYHLTRHAEPTHMPGYPFLLFAGRFITFHIFSDAFVAQCLGYLTWICGLFLARAILERVAPPTLHIGLLLYGLFPLLGVVAAADPGADLLAYVAVLSALLFAIDGRYGAFAAAAGAGLLVHQAYYPCFAILALACVSKGMRWRYALASGVPFAAYYLAIAHQKNDINWMLSFYPKRFPSQHGGFPVFDWLVGTLSRGGASNAVKTALLAATFAVATALLIACIRRRNWLLLAICAPIVLAGIFTPTFTAWFIFRLAKFTVLPACWWLSDRPRTLRALNAGIVYPAITLFLVFSQFAWAHYDIVWKNPAIEPPAASAMAGSNVKPAFVKLSAAGLPARRLEFRVSASFKGLPWPPANRL